MSLSEWIKIFTNKDYKKVSEQKYYLIHNQERIDKVFVFNNKLHSETMTKLRTFKTPQYESIFVLKGKKGFNTIGFNLHYDVVICDRNGKIVNILNDVKQGYISEYYQDSHYIYFFTIGSVGFYKLKVNDILTLGRVW